MVVGAGEDACSRRRGRVLASLADLNAVRDACARDESSGDLGLYSDRIFACPPSDRC